MEKHLFTNVLNNVSSSTFDRYVNLYNVHIKDSSIGNLLIKDLSPIQIQEYFNSKNTLAVDEQKRYTQSIKEENLYLFFLTALSTGMRLGELIALRWENVDLDIKTITIRESMKRSRVYEKDGTYTSENVIKTPKTQNSIRVIPIPPFLLDLLMQNKPSKINEDSLVFTSKTGTMLISRNAMRAHHRVCERAKINPRLILEKTIYDGVGFHALRHTFATRLLEKNVNIKIISDLLGHKDIQTTLNIYTHVTVDAKKEVGNVIDSIYNDITH